MLGGALMLSGAVMAAPSATTGIGAIAVAGLGTLGADAVFTGWNQMVSGVPQQTVVYQAGRSAGLSPTGAAALDLGLGLASGGVLAIPRVGSAQVAAQLPRALTLGRNAETGIDVYLGMRNGQAVYCGITCDIVARSAQHERDLRGFDLLSQITRQSVTRGEARAIEQALISRNPGFENLRNSISPGHPWFDDAVQWGESWLNKNGF
jgi:hypothetical protein